MNAEYDPMRDAERQIATLRRLLVGAVTSLIEVDAVLGPEVKSWWKKQPESQDRLAVHICSELSDEDLNTLQEYLDRNDGKLPCFEEEAAPQSG